MSVSKHRKNHKKKVEQFKQKAQISKLKTRQAQIQDYINKVNILQSQHEEIEAGAIVNNSDIDIIMDDLLINNDLNTK